MSFSHITLLQAYDWIEQRLDGSRPSPTDVELCERFGLDSPERAWSLLVALADAGGIRVRGVGEDRRITLRHPRRAAAATLRVLH